MSASWKRAALWVVIATATGATLGARAGDSVTVSPNPTFTRDIAPIFQAKCQECHQPGSIAPMSLITYEDARPWARSIRLRVSTRQMPPWHVDRGIGIQRFKNDMSLSDAQIDTIVKWIDQGGPQGDPADMPKPKPVDTSLMWRAEKDGFGPPDIVVRSREQTIPAVHQDEWWRSVADIPGLTEPRWVRMVEIRPTNIGGRKVVHHAIAYLVLKDDPDAVNHGTTGSIAGPSRGGSVDPADQVQRLPQLMEWAIGKAYDRYREGTGKLIVPGEQIAWDQHIHAAGEDVTTGTELGIWLYPKGEVPKHRSYLVGFSALKDGAQGLDIQPNSIAMTDGFTLLKQNAIIENFQPHFHLRGKAMRVEAILPDGTSQIISSISNFNFNWMTNYIYADDAAPAFPKGTIIHVTAWYDNTTANKNNPDPNQWVGFGDRTIDEMGHAWMNVAYISDAEYEEWLAQRKKVTTNNTQQQ